MIQNYINHIAIVVDRSGSMSRHKKEVVKVFDAEIAHLRQRSIDLKQETRVSVYLFDTHVECLVFDMDVMRMPSLEGYYQLGDMTALLDATEKAIRDNQELPELYGDHAFLVYVLTDGQENASHIESLKNRIDSLPENWTIALMVPDARGIHEAKKFGFPENSVQIWNPNEVTGVESAGKKFRSAIDNYMTLRASGVRGTKNFFQIDVQNLTTSQVSQNLESLKPNQYKIYVNNFTKKMEIRDFVEARQNSTYVNGSSYYELIKSEKVQAQKEVCIQDRQNGKMYTGPAARNLLTLPNYEVKVKPGDFGKWKIFIQSTSYNRGIIPNQSVVVLQ